MIIPWIYLFYNEELSLELQQQRSSSHLGKGHGANFSSLSRSEMNYKGASQTKSNNPGFTGKEMHSNINESNPYS